MREEREKDKNTKVVIPQFENILKNRKKKYIRLKDAEEVYSMCNHTIRALAEEAHAVVKLRKVVLIDTERMDEFWDTFRE